MALKADISTHAGVFAENQYVKVLKVECDKNEIEMTVSFSPVDNTELMYETFIETIPFDLESGENPIKQSYAWLKSTLYPNAIDV